MLHVVFEDVAFDVPPWVVDLESFRRWSVQDDFPERVRISFLRGEVWVDVSREQRTAHHAVLTAIDDVLDGKVKADGSGMYLGRGGHMTNLEAGFSTQPDALFVSKEAFASGQARASEQGDAVLGVPDMVVEVVSRRSAERFNEILREAYAAAGVREYWFVDVRRSPLKFDILRLGRRGYAESRKRGGWVRSDVFGQSFRLIRHSGDDGRPSFTLETRAAERP